MTSSALVTGGAGGLGRATTDLLVEQGWHVFVTDSNLEALKTLQEHPRVTPIPMDVTNIQSIQATKELVAEKTTGLEAVINFAGILVIGSMIEMDEAIMQKVLDINVMGTFRVNQVFFPLLQNNKGRIINISSETGWQTSGPFNGAYSASKYAIEAYNDALRRELALLGMTVIKIQPGAFNTSMVQSIESKFRQAMEQSTLFKSILARVGTLAAKEQSKSKDASILAQAVYRALTARRPKTSYSVKPSLERSLLEYLPTRWADRLYKMVLTRSQQVEAGKE